MNLTRVSYFYYVNKSGYNQFDFMMATFINFPIAKVFLKKELKSSRFAHKH